MFYKRFFALLVTLMLICGWQGLSAQTLEDILSKHAEATGGKDALEALRNTIAKYEEIPLKSFVSAIDFLVVPNHKKATRQQ